MADTIDANGMSPLDMQQVIRKSVTVLSSGELAQKVALIGGSLVPNQYDQISLTYVTAGNGIGEIETVTYRYVGNIVAVLTLAYDPGSRLIDVVRS
jgi:hypothetical protein